jgi:rare lipoprotein A (peptidoglycan hydrolase)
MSVTAVTESGAREQLPERGVSSSPRAARLSPRGFTTWDFTAPMEETAPAVKASTGWRAAVWPLVAAGFIAFAVAVPLKVVPLKKEKAEAEAVPPRIHIERPAQIGVASWYGDREAGRKTASGETFKPHLFTAAHRTLPLGTEVRVTDLHSGQWVDVIVNDRGPYVRGRIIDLSVGAAEALHIKPKGLARVKIEVLTEPSMPIRVAAKRATKKLSKDRQKGLVAMPPAEPRAGAQTAKQAEPPPAQPTAAAKKAESLAEAQESP